MAGNNLGTAWIQIKPSMKGMTSSIRSELGGIGGTEGASAGSSFSTAFAAKIGAVSAITERVLASGINMIKNQLSDAVLRADTLERFPKVMTQMGYSAGMASDTIKKLMKGVEEVPTPLNEVVSGTQRLVNVTHNMEKASDWILAISDAMLSNGASASRASDATEQFLQVIQRGKPLGQDWLTIMEVAPGIMEELAKSLGYTSAAMGGDMYTALQNGKLSMESFMGALVDIDKNGTKSLTALSELAKTATGGIETSITTMKQSISNAIVAVIQEIGAENITAFIEKVKDAMVGLVNILKDVFMFLKDNWSWLQYVAGAIVAFFAGATIIKGILKIKNAFSGLHKTIQGIFGKAAETTLAKSAERTFSGIGKGISSALVSLKDILVNAVNVVMEPIKTLLKGIGEAIAGFFKAFASPDIAMGAAMFAIAAASIAAAIFLIGSAIGAVMPALKELFDNIIMPIAQFIADTVLTLINTLTDAVIRLTNGALIPLGEFLVNSFVLVLQSVTDMITGLTQGALIPLIDTLSGAFVNVIRTVGDVLNNILGTALRGISEIIIATGDAFEHMGNAIEKALNGAIGVLRVFADIITAVSDAAVAIVAMATNHSINYGRGYAHLFADGGRVYGEGTSTSDSVPAFLSKGEYVIKASSAQRIGYDNLDNLNESGDFLKGQTNYFTINGYNKSPEELANIISRKIAFNQRGVLG